MLKQKYLKPLFFFFVIILMLIYGVYKAKDEDSELKKNAKITAGTITSINVYGGVYYAYYSFSKDSILIKGHCRILDFNIESIRKIFDLLEKRKIPIVYSSTDASNSKILFSKSDFNEYKIAVDSQFISVLVSIDSLKNVYQNF